MSTAKTRHAAWTYDFTHTVEDVWEYLIHTDRMNLAMGLPAVSYQVVQNPAGGSYRIGSFSLKGIKISWTEEGYEWEENRFMRIERNYSAGPFKKVLIEWRLEKTPAGCRLHQEFTYSASHPLLGPLTSFQINKDVRAGFLKCYATIESHLNKKVRPGFEIFPPFVEAKGVTGKERRALKERLRQEHLDDEVSDRLLDYVFSAQEADLFRLRPLRIARQLGVSRMESVSAFLKATRAGLFSLSWQILCPRCRGSKETGSVLSKLSATVHCDTCNISFTNDRTQSVELTFTPVPSLRKTQDLEYCAGAPGNTRHFLVQKKLRAGEKIDFSVNVCSQGTYRLRSLQSQNTWTLVCNDDGENRVEAVFQTGDAQKSILVSTGKIQISVENRLGHDLFLVLERCAWLDDVCTAAMAASLPEFRSVFTTNILGLGERVEFSSLAVLFTDLAGSTALYSKIGDADAFVMVQRHFEALSACVRNHEGAVVKTIGDSIMAVFAKPENAISAGLEIQSALKALISSENLQHELKVRVGIHNGPCFIINLNNQLDYFGSTVNLAARVQTECGGGDVMISGKMIDDPGVRDVLKRVHRSATQVVRTLKGFENEVEIYQIQSPVAQSSDRLAG